MLRRVLAVVTVMLLAGCGSTSVVVSGTTSARPYDGPMWVPVDHSDDATVAQRSGAAGRALECPFEPHTGGGGYYMSGLESVQDGPAAALADFLAEEGLGSFLIPAGGYRVERDDGHRVLLSYDVHDHTKVAVIVADDIRDFAKHTGWGVETWAMCDPAELPARITEDRNIGVWTDDAGHRIPVADVQSFQGAEHCDWQDITFLSLDGDARHVDTTVFVRDPSGELASLLDGRFQAHVGLPADATDTGWRRDGRELWLGRDSSAAYLVRVDDTHDVELWPRAHDTVGCA